MPQLYHNLVSYIYYCHIFGFCLLLVLISPLPLAFIQQRGQNNLFIPLTGWAILVGTLSWTLIRTITPANLLGGRPARVVRIVLVTLLIALWRRDRNWRAKFSVDAVAEQQRADLGRDPTIAQPTCEAPSADPGCCCCMILSRTGRSTCAGTEDKRGFIFYNHI